MKIPYQLAIMMGLLFIISLFSACSSPTSFHASYYYHFRIQPDAPIENLTLYIPLPIQNGTPKIGTLYLTPEKFSDERYIHGPLPPQSNFSFHIEEVKGVPFLKITADAMNPEQVYQFDYSKSIDTPPNTYLVNTRYPFGNESVLMPKSNLSEYTHLPSELNYTTSMYADYKMKGSGTLFIMDGLIVSNGWYLNFAWLGNDYTDGFNFNIYDESHGWQKVKGTMTVGNGRYLN